MVRTASGPMHLAKRNTPDYEFTGFGFTHFAATWNDLIIMNTLTNKCKLLKYCFLLIIIFYLYSIVNDLDE
jgi:hypothetical protein